MQGPIKMKEYLRSRLARRHTLMTDDAERAEEDDALQDLALWLGQGAIDPDNVLLQRLAKNSEAMLGTDDNGLTPLALAITSGADKVAEAFLLQMPPCLASQLMEQRLTDAYVTHLLLTAYWPEGELPMPLVKALLEAGSELQALDTEGNSLLHLLIRNEQHAALEAILSSKDEEPFSKISAVLDDANGAGFAPLHEAVHRHHLRAVKALLSAGANVNVMSRSSHLTCLHYAALESDSERAVELTQLLLTGPGLEINERTLEGKTATDIAEERDNQELLALLKNNGGVHLFEPCSEEEDGATAAAPQESDSLAQAHQRLLEALSVEEFRALGREVLSAAQSRLLERAASPGPVFLRLLATARRSGEEVGLVTALRRAGRMELAELVANARVT